MLPPPPTSTLFPYTTLFRSDLDPLDLPVAAQLDHRSLAMPRVVDEERAVAPDRLDRKSTRLNSSHANISYAVFCLKKKKQHNLLLRTIKKPIQQLTHKTDQH